MPVSLVIDTAGGANFAGHHARNMASLHVGGSGLAAGVALQVTGNMSVSGGVTFVSGLLDINADTAGFVDIQSLGSRTLRLNALGNNVEISRHLFIPSTFRVYLDGGGDTYLVNSSVDRIDLVSAGSVVFRANEGGINQSFLPFAIPAAQRFYLDGGGDTYLVQNVDNIIEVFAGGVSSVWVTATSFQPGANNARELGVAAARWSNVFSVLGNFSGLITAAAGITVTGTATATTFSGSGSSLTALPSGQLTGALPAISGAALTNLAAAAMGAGTFAGLMTFGAGLAVTGGVAGAGRLTVSAAGGLELTGVVGSSHDFRLLRPSDGFQIMRVPTGTLDVTFLGVVSANGFNLTGQPFSFGANDSAGAGFRQVRVPN